MMTLVEARDLLFEADPTRSLCVAASCWKFVTSCRDPRNATNYTVSISQSNDRGVDWQDRGVEWQEYDIDLPSLVARAIRWLENGTGASEDPRVGEADVDATDKGDNDV